MFECRVDSGVVGRLHEPVDAAGAERRRRHVLGPRDRRGGQRRRDARDAVVHGRHRAAAGHHGAGHDDHLGPDGHDERQPAVVRVHARARPGSTFECKLDGRAPGRTCTSPWTTAALADGAHTSRCARPTRRATPTPTPATRSFTVDTAPPPDTTAPTRRSRRARPARPRRRAVVHVHRRPRRARRSSASSTPAACARLHLP